MFIYFKSQDLSPDSPHLEMNMNALRSSVLAHIVAPRVQHSGLEKPPRALRDQVSCWDLVAANGFGKEFMFFVSENGASEHVRALSDAFNGTDCAQKAKQRRSWASLD